MWVPNLANLGRKPEAPKKPPPKELFTSSVPVTLKEVVDKEDKVIAEGVLKMIEEPDIGVTATVGDVSWSFKQDAHCMASILNEGHAQTYLFAQINGNADKFYVVVLQESFPAEEREKLDALLKERTQYSVSARKEKGFVLPSLNELIKKAQQDTKLVMDQAAKLMGGPGGGPHQSAAGSTDAAPAPQQ